MRDVAVNLVGGISMLAALIFYFALLSLAKLEAADVKPAWQAQWDKTVAAAKKEGRLNFYVGRYGAEKLLADFNKEFPGDQNCRHQRRGQLAGHFASSPKAAPARCSLTCTAAAR